MLSPVAAYVKLVQDISKALDQALDKADIVNCKSPIWEENPSALAILHDIQTMRFWMIDVLDASELEIGLKGGTEGLMKSVTIYIGKYMGEIL